MVQPIQHADALPEVRAVFEDIMATRGLTDVNNFWKYLAHDPVTLRRTWESLKEVMRPGELDPLVKEMIYLAVSMTNGCDYCIASHTAAARAEGPDDRDAGRTGGGGRHGERDQPAGTRLAGAGRCSLRRGPGLAGSPASTRWRGSPPRL